MNKEEEKNLQHAMTSFAMFGGLFLGNKPKQTRTVSEPHNYKPTPKK